jgi:hypothetical protein
MLSQYLILIFSFFLFRLSTNERRQCFDVDIVDSRCSCLAFLKMIYQKFLRLIQSFQEIGNEDFHIHDEKKSQMLRSMIPKRDQKNQKNQKNAFRALYADK